MSHPALVAADAQLRRINARLAADERRILEAMVGRNEGLLPTAKAMRLRKVEAIALLRQALSKVTLYYDEQDAEAAKQAGRMH